jgi:Zn-dependent M28 family amino/carboxypeptidase
LLIVFLAVTGEEQGLLGSAYYAEHPLFPLANTVADVNMDELLGFEPRRDRTITGYGQSDMDDYARAEQDARLLFRVGQRLASETTFPEWNANSEFRATREKSRPVQ